MPAVRRLLRRPDRLLVRGLPPFAHRISLVPSIVLIVALATVRATETDQVGLLATLADPAITESSGLVASRQTPGLLWTHNDSGDGATLYATDGSGRALGRFAVTGAENVDWEDLAIGPGAAGGNALYIADTGDNTRARDDLALYRVAEPVVDPEAPPPIDEPVATAPAERFPFTYADGRHDAETLLVHPMTGETVLVTKDRSADNGVYRFPQSLVPDQPSILVRVATVRLPGPIAPLRAATGGAVAPDASRLAVRSLTTAYEWPLASDQSLVLALAGEPRAIPLPLAQGEAIAYRADGRSLLATAEGAPCRLFEVLASSPAATRAAEMSYAASSRAIWARSRPALRAPPTTEGGTTRWVRVES